MTTGGNILPLFYGQLDLSSCVRCSGYGEEECREDIQVRVYQGHPGSPMCKRCREEVGL